MDVCSLKFTFGKHKGKTVLEVYTTDKSYLDWCMTQPNLASKFGTAINKCQEVLANIAGIPKPQVNANEVTQDNMDNNIITVSNYRIEYGMYINFPEHIIINMIKMLNVDIGRINNFLTYVRYMGDNMNKNISQYSNDFFLRNHK